MIEVLPRIPCRNAHPLKSPKAQKGRRQLFSSARFRSRPFLKITPDTGESLRKATFLKRH
jgi:hypothetical protein